MTLNQGVGTEVTVDFAVTAGTATLTNDYTVVTSPNTLTFDANDQLENIEISIVDDIYYEADEQFTVALSNATSGVTIGTAASTGVAVTIPNDDPAPAFTITETVSINENASPNTSQFVVTQTPGSGVAVSVPYTFTDGTAIEGTDYTATGGKTGTLDFPASDTPQASVMMNIGFSVIDDLVYEGNKSFTVVLSEPTPSAAGTIDTASNTHIGTADDC